MFNIKFIKNIILESFKVIRAKFYIYNSPMLYVGKMRELSENEMCEIAEKLVNTSLKIGRRPDGSFEAVQLTYNNTDPTCEKFAMIVEEACWKVGATVLTTRYSSKRSKKRYELSPIDSLSQLNHLTKAIAENVDVRIFIGEEDEPGWISSVLEKYRASAPVRMKLIEIMNRRKVRWVYFGWPLPEAAKIYEMDPRVFRDIFFDSIRMSFSEETLELCKYYSNALTGGRIVKIEADDGTNLSFSIKGRPILVDDGIISEEDIARGDVGLNIPSGEVFVAPLETTANGRIFFEKVAIPGFGKIKGLWLTFKDGKVAEYDAEEGTEVFKKFMEANTGDKDRIAELGIGCNRGARYTGGSIIIDEKIYGTIHIAIGDNSGAYHGKNRASSHLDMIKNMEKGRLWIDEKLIMDRGRPVKW